MGETTNQTMRFKSQSRELGRLPYFEERRVKSEPMFFSANLTFAYEHGGAITRAFIDALPRDHQVDPTAYVDSRVHMLMPGWFPCIPGWHHDDVPRNTPDGQPNYVDPPYRTRHIAALVNALIAPPQFLEGEVEVPAPVPGSAIYKQWDDAISRTLNFIDRPGFFVKKARDLTLIEFDCDTFHRGSPATANGWRWFGRVSVGRERRMSSEIRQQVQVYMPTINAGW